MRAMRLSRREAFFSDFSAALSSASSCRVSAAFSSSSLPLSLPIRTRVAWMARSGRSMRIRAWFSMSSVEARLPSMAVATRRHLAALRSRAAALYAGLAGPSSGVAGCSLSGYGPGLGVAPKSESMPYASTPFSGWYAGEAGSPEGMLLSAFLVQVRRWRLMTNSYSVSSVGVVVAVPTG